MPEREIFITRQAQIGENDDYDSENSWIFGVHLFSPKQACYKVFQCTSIAFVATYR